jgi:EPS-associated MarR family transcriptional regulator
MNERTLLDTATRYRLLKRLEANPGLSQRALARELGVSLGKVNYCLRALMDKGLIKARNFRDSRNKLAYLYVLTPKGVAEKARLTMEYLRIKVAEAEAIQREIEALRREAAALASQEEPRSCA